MRARFRATLGAFALDVEFTAPDRGVIGLFGPSGSGKTTLLRCIAGLQRLRDGHFSVGGETWQDGPRGVFVPVHKRGVGYVFQEPSLFPHLTVRKNILYGFARVAGRKRSVQFRQAIEWTGIANLLDRMPYALSGGERQRVAIARALLSSPKLLLLDEPLASLDEASRAEIIPCLDRLHRELSVPIIMVSHSLREIARIADTLVLVRDGRVLQCGPLSDVLPSICATDDDLFAVIDAPVFEHDETYHLSRLQTPFGALWTGQVNAEIGEIVRIQIAARDVSIGKSNDAGSSIVNQLPARIAAMTERTAGNVLLQLAPIEDGAHSPSLTMFSLITRRSWDRLQLGVGQAVFARVKGVGILR